MLLPLAQQERDPQHRPILQITWALSLLREQSARFALTYIKRQFTKINARQAEIPRWMNNLNRLPIAHLESCTQEFMTADKLGQALLKRHAIQFTSKAPRPGQYIRCTLWFQLI